MFAQPITQCLIALLMTLASTAAWVHAAARQADFNGDGRADLAIGVPRENVNDQADAGAVAVIYGKSTGLNQAGDQFWTAESPGINGPASAGANFGSALAAGDFVRIIRSTAMICWQSSCNGDHASQSAQPTARRVAGMDM